MQIKFVSYKDMYLVNISVIFYYSYFDYYSFVLCGNINVYSPPVNIRLRILLGTFQVWIHNVSAGFEMINSVCARGYISSGG